MNLRQAHKKAEHERIKREIMNIIERRLIFDVTIGMKAVFLLALKKEGWGKQRAMRLFEEVERIEQGLYDGEKTSSAVSNGKIFLNKSKKNTALN